MTGLINHPEYLEQSQSWTYIFENGDLKDEENIVCHLILNWNNCSDSVWNKLRPVFYAFLSLMIPCPSPAPQVHNICRKSAATEVELPGKYLPGNQTDPWNDA